ncbi:MAG TPA: hypothetical protein VGV86_09885 [Acidimicrobiales bacterium]|nr:hypothetical protein [Acidimicrobiales bacterium]
MHIPLDTATADRLGSVAPCDLLKALEANSRFRRDSLLGGIFHPGKLSYREISPTDSLHILIDGAEVSAHVDEISPLRVRPDGSTRYAWGRVVAHNLLVVIGDAARRVRGLHGAQRCNLHCDVEWFDDASDQGACDDHDHDHEAA